MKNFIPVLFVFLLGCNYSPARDACYRKLYQQKYYGACDANLILANLFKERAKEKSNDPAIDTAFDYFLVNCLQRLETQKRCDKKSNYTLEYNPP